MNVQEFLDAYTRLTSHGWLTLEEALLLVAWVERTSGPMLEIGCYQGRSAMLLAQLEDRITSERRILYCVDPWGDSFSSDHTGGVIFRKFQDNIMSLPGCGENVLPYRMRIEDWEARPVELVYCDGDHSREGTRRQIEKAKGCGAKVIAIHDVNDEGDGAIIKEVALAMLGEWTEKVGRLAIWDLRRKT